MSKAKTIRAWKDVEYRESLSAAELSQLEENPAGLMQLTDDDLLSVNGGLTTGILARSSMPCLRALTTLGKATRQCHHTILFFC